MSPSNQQSPDDFNSLKEEGNKRFKEKNYKDAIKYYTKAIEVKGDEAAAFANRAACHLKLQNYFNVLSDCNRALELDASFSKAYFRRATALRELSRFTLAKRDFEKVSQLEGNSECVFQVKQLDRLLANNDRIDLKIFPKPEGFRSNKQLQTFELNNQYNGSKLYSLNRSPN